MSLMSLFLGQKKNTTANVAKERLQIILAHERSGRGASADYLPQLQKELMAVISKYVNIDPDDIRVNLEREGNFEVLEVKIEMPSPK